MSYPTIMATMADVRCTPQFIGSLLAAGASSVRVNSAHVDPERFTDMVTTLRSVKPDIPILMDTKGPEIRIGAFADGMTVMHLRAGDHVTLRSSSEPCEPGLLTVSYGRLAYHVAPGDRLLLDDGEIELRVIASDPAVGDVAAEVSAAGILLPRKSMSVPGADISDLPAVTERDAASLRAAAHERIAMVAHSFVRSADDIRRVRAILEENGRSGVSLIAKIECRAALARFDEILDEADGLLVARGDLGIEIDPTLIPVLQSEIIRRCRHAGKPVIVATQMLHSMIHHPRPTRAEVADIVQACREGASTLLLCGETASGEYPVEAVKMMHRAIASSDIDPYSILNRPIR